MKSVILMTKQFIQDAQTKKFFAKNLYYIFFHERLSCAYVTGCQLLICLRHIIMW